MLTKVYVAILSLLIPLGLWGQTISPKEFGFMEAQTEEQRYEVLYKTHKEACEKGCGVNYDGLLDFTLTIPDKAQSIPLPRYTDFAGVKITVKNETRTMTLFSMVQPSDTVEVSVNQLEKGNYKKMRS